DLARGPDLCGQRPRFLESRRRPLLRPRADRTAVRAVDPVRGAVPADERARSAPPRALGLRARGPRRRPRLGTPTLRPAAPSVAGRRRIRRERLADDAAA